MTVRAIVRFPDPGLRRPAEFVSAFDADLRTLAADLLDTMHAAPGIGITAPHIGVPLRLTVIELSPAAPRVYVNPSIAWASDEKMRYEEGSISMPGVTDPVERHSRVRVTYRSVDGEARQEEADGLLAVCLQHEIDQLDGIFWLQRLSRLRRDRLVRRYEKLRGRNAVA